MLALRAPEQPRTEGDGRFRRSLTLAAAVASGAVRCHSAKMAAPIGGRWSRWLPRVPWSPLVGPPGVRWRSQGERAAETHFGFETVKEAEKSGKGAGRAGPGRS